MLSQPILFLLLLLIIGYLANNKSLMIAVAFLLIVKLIGIDDKIFHSLKKNGIHWGVTVITIAVLVPIATGDIGFKQFFESIRSPYAWIALISGISVALIAKYGLNLLTNDPHITTSLVLGTILAVALFKGVAVGPLIGAGIAYIAMKIVKLIF